MLPRHGSGAQHVGAHKVLHPHWKPTQMLFNRCALVILQESSAPCFSTQHQLWTPGHKQHSHWCIRTHAECQAADPPWQVLGITGLHYRPGHSLPLYASAIGQGWHVTCWHVGPAASKVQEGTKMSGMLTKRSWFSRDAYCSTSLWPVLQWSVKRQRKFSNNSITVT